MKFSKSILDKDEFFKKISDLLEDKECIIFIDTNIFALLFKLYSSARNEFFEWAQPLIDLGRIRTPVWALNEYTNRAIRNKTNDYLSPLKKIKTTQKDFKEIYNFLKMSVDEESLKNTTYKSREEYIADLDIIAEKLSKVTVLSKGKEASYIENIHDEIENKFGKSVLESNIFEILKYVQDHGNFRFSNKLPPGFEDETKDENSYGDLIIWTEILNYCGKNRHLKAIVLTNDNKKDWAYAPSKIKVNSRIVPNKPPEFKVIDPRLVYEFKLKTNSEELHLINFETLSKLLVKKHPLKSLNLAIAFQIANEDKEPEIFTEAHTESAIARENTDAIVLKSDILNPYSEYALQDFYFPVNNSGFFNIIDQLKSYSWNTQNRAIEQLLEIPFNDFEETQELKDELFVMGRNIYQAACGRAFSAIRFLENLYSHLLFYSTFVSNALFSGILYEIYFNNRGEFRKEKLKTTYLNEAFSVNEFSKLNSSIEFITDKLSPFKDELIYIPSETLKGYEIKIELSLLDRDIEDVYYTIQQIEKISLDDRNLLIENPYPFGNTTYRNQEELEIDISLSLAIPKDLIVFSYKPKIENDLPIDIIEGYSIGISEKKVV